MKDNNYKAIKNKKEETLVESGIFVSIHKTYIYNKKLISWIKRSSINMMKISKFLKTRFI